MNIILSKAIRKIEYLLNKRATYDYEPQRGGWIKYKSPVFGDESTASAFDPFVIEMDDNYRLFVSERKNSSIICADSLDGVKWGDWEVSLRHGETDSWEERVNRASVCKKDNKWFMWYTGQSKQNSSIGLAISEDGIHFERICKGPVLFPENSYEKDAVMNPCVIWDVEESLFKMWYAAGEQFEPDVICYATSTDGITWKRYAQNPIFTKSENKYDQCKVGGCHVIKATDGTYTLFYIGYQNVDTARICVAKSKNGISDWRRIEDNPILSPSRDSWDSDAVYKPSVLYDAKSQTWKLWYNGRKKNVECIGCAENRGKDGLII